MLLKYLDIKNPTYDVKRWGNLTALADGGEKFHARIREFLPQNPMEPHGLYENRIREAHYHSYIGSVANLYTSWLFAAEFSVKAYKRGSEEPLEDVDRFYGDFQEDVGDEQTLSRFMRERFREGMITGASYWLIELPTNDGEEPVTKADYERRKLGHPRLTALDREELWDWDYDSEGQFAWALTHTLTVARPTLQHPRTNVIETWRYYTKDDVTTFTAEYEDGKRPKDEVDIPADGPYPHGFKRVPIVDLSIPVHLCIGEVARDPQLEYFRLDNALSYAIRRTCYAMPVVKVADTEQAPPKIGVGYYLQIGPDDDFKWESPNADAYDLIRRARDTKRDELYRIVHQMAQGLDNNAETVGRSAESKEIDAAATRIMLNAYGGYISQAIEETYELISEARGEVEYEWSVEGFSGYDTATASTLIVNTRLAKELGVPSKTFHREISTKVALAMLPETDQRVKDAIRDEIADYDFPVTSETVDQEQAGVDSNAPPAAKKNVAAPQQEPHGGEPERST